MKTKFDELCSQYIGETIVNPGAVSPTISTTNSASTKPTTTQPASPQPTPPANQNPEIQDDQLLELLKQRMADANFQKAFGDWLKSQQQNAA